MLDIKPYPAFYQGFDQIEKLGAFLYGINVFHYTPPSLYGENYTQTSKGGHYTQKE